MAKALFFVKKLFVDNIYVAVGAAQAVVVHAVTDDEVVGDGAAYIVNLVVATEVAGFEEESAEGYAGGLKLAKLRKEVLHREAAVDDVLDDDDVATATDLGEAKGFLHLTRGGHALVGGVAHKRERRIDGHAAGEVGGKHIAAREDGTEDGGTIDIVARNLIGHTLDGSTNFAFGHIEFEGLIVDFDFFHKKDFVNCGLTNDQSDFCSLLTISIINFNILQVKLPKDRHFSY